MTSTVDTQAYGTIQLSVLRNRHSNWELLANNLLTADSTPLVQRKRSRWSIQMLFRDTKQCGGGEDYLTDCVSSAGTRHDVRGTGRGLR
jgi:hypothetical protein